MLPTIASAPSALPAGISARRYHRSTGESLAKNALALCGGNWLITRAHSTGVCNVVAGVVQYKSAVRAQGAWLASGAYQMKLFATCTLSVSSANTASG